MIKIDPGAIVFTRGFSRSERNTKIYKSCINEFREDSNNIHR